MGGYRAASFTSPRLRGQVDRVKRGRVRGALQALNISTVPLTPTLSPQAGRGSTPVVWTDLCNS
jgi:hypothetical protein